MDALETLDEDRLDSEQERPLGGPVARGASAVLLAPNDEERRTLSDVAHCRVVDAHLLAGGEMESPVAFLAVDELIAQSDIGERSPDHHLVVPATRAVRVEFVWRDAVLDQVATGWAVLGNASRRRDVIGRDRVPQERQHPRAADVAWWSGLVGDVLEERRGLHVRGVFAPLVDVAGRHVETLPALVPGEDHRVLLTEHGRVHRGLNGGPDLLLGWPDITQVDGLAVGITPDRVRREIEIDRAGQSIGDHQRWGSQKGGPHLRVDA